MFAPLQSTLRMMPGTAWPAPAELNILAARLDTRSGGGKALRFCALAGQPAPAAADYELGTHDDGVVPLRVANWHDVFNALVWLTFPHTKAALNRVHSAELRGRTGAMRSVRRDALTLLDESGVLVLSSDPAVLAGIRAFEWQQVFWKARETLTRTTRFILFGHALYEKALAPYVGMTGHALLLAAPADFAAQDELACLQQADRLAASAVHAHIMRPHDLSPLPVLGVPGWWAANREAAFYDNARYFRSGRTRRLSDERNGRSD